MYTYKKDISLFIYFLTLRCLGAKLRKQLEEKFSTKMLEESDLVPLQLAKDENPTAEKFGGDVMEFFSHKNALRNQPNGCFNLAKFLDDALSEGHNFVGIVGEPGVGKTSLVKSLLQNRRSSAAVFFHRKANAHEKDGAYIFYIPFKYVELKKELVFLISWLARCFPIGNLKALLTTHC